jgi:hypothetical protein
METTAEKAVADLLRETEAAHGAYETNVLGGVFDEEWPAWYAIHLLDHGLGDHLPGAEGLDVRHAGAARRGLRARGTDPSMARRLCARDRHRFSSMRLTLLHRLQNFGRHEGVIVPADV